MFLVILHPHNEFPFINSRHALTKKVKIYETKTTCQLSLYFLQLLCSQVIVMFKFLVYYAIPLVFIASFYIVMARHLVLSTKNMPGEAQGQGKQIQARKKVNLKLRWSTYIWSRYRNFRRIYLCSIHILKNNASFAVSRLAKNWSNSHTEVWEFN